ncbi:MAG: MFS transporter [Rhodospirillales bacterium]|nr:MFS transporter [Rhodospirillales bacterium]
MRNVIVLCVCQALSMSGAVLVFAVVALAGKTLAPTPELVTVPLAIQFFSMMVATVPASLIMGRIGRRLGFTLGQAIGLLAALVSALAMIWGNFWLLALSAIGIGIHSAFYQYLRFAAAETASPAFRPRAISYVMAGGVASAFIGPELANQTAEILAPALFAGSYLALGGLCLLNILALQFVRIPLPVKLARGETGRGLVAIARQPRFVVAVLAALTGYGVMNLVMVATPLAMVGCGFTFGDSTDVLRWHVLGMFVPSFFTGHLIRRFGVMRIITAGALLLIASMAINLAGIAYWNFMVALTCLGIGWNFTFIGGTTLLTETHRPEEGAKTQALNDLLVFTTTAITSFASGFVQLALGWQTVNALSIFPVLITLAAVLAVTRSEARRRAA